jgi:allophanate hydrolase subunit 2
LGRPALGVGEPTQWEVSADLDRVGVRLCGPALARSRPEELPSEGIVAGAVQVPPSGHPIIFLADHPTTGGYPVIAVVVDADLDRAGQLRPGDRVRFSPIPSSASWPPSQTVE